MSLGPILYAGLDQPIKSGVHGLPATLINGIIMIELLRMSLKEQNLKISVNSVESPGGRGPDV